MSPQDNPSPAEFRGIGERLRAAREDKGLEIAQAAAKLKMPVHVVEALERENWQALGAAVFARGQMRSYAKLLGIDAEQAVASIGAQVQAPVELVPQTYTPRLHRLAEQTRMRLVYLVLTATIAVPVWLAMRTHVGSGAETVPLDGVATGAIAAPARAMPQTQTRPAASQRPAPLVASMAPMPGAPAPSGGLVVRFEGESWVSLNAPDGSTVEQALIPAGEQRSFALERVGRVTLGNATQVQVSLHGQPVDLAPFIRANVARFTVSSDGSLQPVGR